jgi:hypothetical protein
VNDEAATAPSPPEADEPDEAASAAEVGTLRRWLWVAGLWAVAASVIAVIALLEEEPPPPGEDKLAITSRIAQVERRLTPRVERLEDRIGSAAAADDVTKLERRLGRAEDDASAASKTAAEVNKSLEDLLDRVEALEERVEDLETESGAADGGGTSR